MPEVNLLKRRSLSWIDWREECCGSSSQLSDYLIVSRSVVVQVAAVLTGVAPVPPRAGGPGPAEPPGGGGGRHLPLLGLGGRPLSGDGSLTVLPGDVASRHHLRYYNTTRPTLHISWPQHKNVQACSDFLSQRISPHAVSDTDLRCYVLVTMSPSSSYYHHHRVLKHQSRSGCT